MARRREKKEPSKFGAYFITGLMVILMVASILGVMLYAPRSAEDVYYGDYEFSIDQNRGLYVTEKDGVELRFSNLPYTVLSVPFDPDIETLLRTATNYAVTFDPTVSPDDLLYTDFVRFELFQQMNALGAGITKPSEDYQLNVVTCDMSTPTTPVIELRVSPKSSVTLENGACIVVAGNQTTLLLAKDALLYRYHEILLPEDIATIPEVDYGNQEKVEQIDEENIQEDVQEDI